MPVNYQTPETQSLHPVPGVRLGYAQAHIRKPNRKDVLLMQLPATAAVAGVFTRNRFCAAPVQVCQAHLQACEQGQSTAAPKSIRALVVNTGCANAGTGEEGLRNAYQTAAHTAQLLNVLPEQVLVFSTGVIMEHLPMARLCSGIGTATNALGQANWFDAAQSIMTTDTVPKASSTQVTLQGVPVTITGIAKGAGMIRPNMATMLSFLATDATIAQPILQQWTRTIADQSFNRITIDGDTSTNDSFVIISTGVCAGVMVQTGYEPHAQALFDALAAQALLLAQAIVRDGEGATKFISVVVEAAKSDAEALQVAYAIAHSPLVKTAFFASDPNLGRILAAVGYAGIDDLNPDDLQLYLNDVHVALNGGRHPNYQEAQGQAVMQQSEITVRVVLGRGTYQTTVWTTDLSHDYVTINADYRS